MSVLSAIDDTSSYLKSAIDGYALSATDYTTTITGAPSYAETNVVRLERLLREHADGQDVYPEELRNRLSILMLTATEGTERAATHEKLTRMVENAASDSRTFLPTGEERAANTARVSELTQQAVSTGDIEAVQEELFLRLTRQEIWTAADQARTAERDRGANTEVVNDLGVPTSSYNNPGGDETTVSHTEALREARDNVARLAGAQDLHTLYNISESDNRELNASFYDLLGEIRKAEVSLQSATSSPERDAAWKTVESALSRVNQQAVHNITELRDLNRLAKQRGVPGLSGSQAFGRSSARGRDRGTEPASRVPSIR